MSEVLTQFMSQEEQTARLAALNLKAKEFGRITKDNAQKPLFVVIPTEQQEICPIVGNIDENGNFTLNEWNDKHFPHIHAVHEQLREAFHTNGTTPHNTPDSVN